jgi:predicted dehydrogenase
LEEIMVPLRTAIIGCGHFAKRHAAFLTAQADVSLVGFCDQAVERAANYNQQYADGKASVYADFRPMFDDLDLDLVYICLPPFAHTNEVELACQHQVHFLIEKPIALTLEQAVEMADWVRESKVKTQVGFMYRFGEAVSQLKRQIQSGGQNGPGFFTARYACNSLHSSWWRDRSKSGGQLVEQVIHLFDMARYFLGEPVQVYSVQENLYHREVADYTVEDASATVIRFASGGIGVISANNGAIPGRWEYDWRLVLPGLTADFSNANHAVFHHTDRGYPATTTIASECDLYLAETLDLLAAIREDRSPAVPIEEGVLSLNLVLAAASAAQQNLPVGVTSPFEMRLA